jgi:hypothetical protein
MLTRAERMPDFRGVQASAVYAGDHIIIRQGKGEVEHEFNPAKREGGLIGAWARVVREGKLPVVVWLDFAAYNQPTPLWGKMPATMIEKCSRAAGLRKAYPSQFGGWYVAGERPDDIETGEEVEESATTTREKPALPPPRPADVLTFTTAREKVPAKPAEVDGSAGFRMMQEEPPREPGSDDGEPEPSDEEVCQQVEERCREAKTLDGLRALAATIKRWPVGNEYRTRAGKAYQDAQSRLKSGAA